MVEITVTIKGEDSTYKQKHLIYDRFEFCHEDPVLKECILQTLQNAKIEPEDIKIRATLQVK